MSKYLDKLFEDLNTREASLRRMLAKGDHRPSVRFDLGSILLRKHQLAEAEAELESVRSAYLEDSSFHTTLGLCKLLLGKTEEGIEALRRSLMLAPDQCTGREYVPFFCELYEQAGLLGAKQGHPRLPTKERLWDEYWQMVCRPWKESWGN